MQFSILRPLLNFFRAGCNRRTQSPRLQITPQQSMGHVETVRGQLSRLLEILYRASKIVFIQRGLAFAHKSLYLGYIRLCEGRERSETEGAQDRQKEYCRR